MEASIYLNLVVGSLKTLRPGRHCGQRPVGFEIPGVFHSRGLAVGAASVFPMSRLASGIVSTQCFPLLTSIKGPSISSFYLVVVSLHPATSVLELSCFSLVKNSLPKTAGVRPSTNPYDKVITAACFS